MSFWNHGPTSCWLDSSREHSSVQNQNYHAICSSTCNPQGRQVFIYFCFTSVIYGRGREFVRSLSSKLSEYRQLKWEENYWPCCCFSVWYASVIISWGGKITPVKLSRTLPGCSFIIFQLMLNYFNFGWIMTAYMVILGRDICHDFTYSGDSKTLHNLKKHYINRHMLFNFLLYGSRIK